MNDGKRLSPSQRSTLDYVREHGPTMRGVVGRRGFNPRSAETLVRMGLLVVCEYADPALGTYYATPGDADTDPVPAGAMPVYVVEHGRTVQAEGPFGRHRWLINQDPWTCPTDYRDARRFAATR